MRALLTSSPGCLALLFVRSFVPSFLAAAACLQALKRPLPIEFTLLGIETVEPWAAVDCLAMAKIMAFELSGNLP
eukprot:SAG22_NODE_947_length_6367_cov_23.437460_8_plen_75_part_00